MTPLPFPTEPTSTLAAIGLGEPEYTKLLQEFARGATPQGSGAKDSPGLQLIRLLANTPYNPTQNVLRNLFSQERRFRAVQDTYWNNTPPGCPDFNVLRDILVELSVIAEMDCQPGEPCSIDFGNGPTPAQVKEAYMALPPDQVAAAVYHGFLPDDIPEIRAFTARNWLNLLPQLHLLANEALEEESEVWHGDLTKLKNERIAAVRETYWDYTPPGSEDFEVLRRITAVIAKAAAITKDPTYAQTKALFDTLPNRGFALMLLGGFSHCDSIAELGFPHIFNELKKFVEENWSKIVSQIETA